MSKNNDLQGIKNIETCDKKYYNIIDKVIYSLYKLNCRVYSKFSIDMMEGFSALVPKQTYDFIKYIQDPSNRADPNNINVMEIGFNAGHSAVTFLSANKNVHVTSFDIGVHDYMKIGKKFIDKFFKNRHNLIIGNSIETVPEYLKNNPKNKFDIILIDGNHDYDFAIGDIFNCIGLSHNKTVILLDDTTYTDKGQKVLRWTEGPTNAIKKLLSIEKINIKEICVYNKIAGMTVFTYTNL